MSWGVCSHLGNAKRRMSSGSGERRERETGEQGDTNNRSQQGRVMDRRADPECQNLLEGGPSDFARIQRPQDLVCGWCGCLRAFERCPLQYVSESETRRNQGYSDNCLHTIYRTVFPKDSSWRCYSFLISNSSSSHNKLGRSISS